MYFNSFRRRTCNLWGLGGRVQPLLHILLDAESFFIGNRIRHSFKFN